MSGVLTELERQGYTGDLAVAPGASVRCLTCQTVVGAADLPVDARSRIEGASDPAENSVVLAVRCPTCETAGALVVRYGPEASPDEADLLAAIPGHLPEVAPAEQDPQD